MSEANWILIGYFAVSYVIGWFVAPIFTGMFGDDPDGMTLLVWFLSPIVAIALLVIMLIFWAIETEIFDSIASLIFRPWVNK